MAFLAIVMLLRDPDRFRALPGGDDRWRRGGRSRARERHRHGAELGENLGPGDLLRRGRSYASI